jgi:hypothetical protein
MKKLMAFIFAALSAALLSPADLYAQAGATGAITGTVLDQKGGAIARGRERRHSRGFELHADNLL